MEHFTRITLNPAVMGGRPCRRGLRITVSTVLGLLAAGRSEAEILGEYPDLQVEDLREALAWSSNPIDPA